MIQTLTLIEYELLDRVKEGIRSDKIRNRFLSGFLLLLPEFLLELTDVSSLSIHPITAV